MFRLGPRVLAAATVLMLLVSPCVAIASEIVLQNVETSAYPVVAMELALSADLVPGSGEPDFLVRENGIAVEGVKVDAMDEDRPPIDVILLMDTSGSMQGRPLSSAKTAAKDFVAAMRPQDRVALLGFSSEPATVIGFTSDSGLLVRGIDSLEARGETALYDGLVQAAKTFKGAENDRYVVVLSDGGDTTSINDIDAALDAVSGVGVPVYAVALASPDYDPAPLRALARKSGGKLVSAKDADSLSSIFQDIARELSSLYTVRYTSSRPSTKDLEIEVVVSSGDEQATLLTAVPNPLYVQGELPDSELPAGSPANATLQGLLAIVIAVAAGVFVYALGSILSPKPSAIEQLKHYEQYQLTPSDTAEAGGVASSRGRILNAVANVAEERGFTGLVRANLERAGLPLRANEYIFLHVLITTIAGVAVQVLTGRILVSALVVAVFVVVPILALRFKMERRRGAFEEQLPDVLSLIAGSLRAGWGIQQAIELVVEEISDPAAVEFRRVQSEARFGLPLEQAMGRMADRLDSEDFRWTVAAITIQREVGGNLAEVLDVVAATIRERAELRRHVNSLTAESRFSMIVLAVLPVFLLVALFVLNPQYVMIMVNAPAGLAALLFGFLLLVVGVIWISRLTKVEV